MNRINWGRVIVGGLAAGVVLNLGEWLLHEVVLRERMEAAASTMGMELPGGSDIALFVAMTFALGILLVWLYAAIRPRYGPGPKAAILSGLVGWVLLYAFLFVHNLAWELFPQDMVTTSTIWGLFELPIATMVGAWLYKERGGATSGILMAGVLIASAALSCSTGDPDPAPADAGRIGGTVAKVDSQLNQAREHIRTIDTLGASAE